MWELDFSFRLLKSRKKLSVFLPMTLIAVCGIAFAMGAALVSLSVIGGFEKAYEQAILGFNSHIVLIREGEIDDLTEIAPVLNSFRTSPYETALWTRKEKTWKWSGGIPFFKDDRMEMLSQKGIQAVTPFIFREGLGIFPDAVEGIVLKGVDPAEMQKVYPVRYEHVDGTVLSDPGEALRQNQNAEIPPVVMGKPLFKRFFPDGAPDEPTVKLLIPKSYGESQKLNDYTQTARVIATFESGLYEFDSQFMLASIEDLRQLFKLKAKTSGVEIVLDDRFKAQNTARALEAALPPGFQAISWDELNEPLFAAMKMEKTLFWIIMILVMVIASFNVMGIILMLVLKRQPDIAILLAMGAREKSVNRCFAFYGGMLGLGGALLGTLLSAAILWSLNTFHWIPLDPQIYFLTELPVEWSAWVWLIFVGATLLICYGVARIASARLIRRGMLAQTFR